MILGARSLLESLELALSEGGTTVSLRRVDAEDLRMFMRAAAKQDAGEGMLVRLRGPSGGLVEPVSLPFIPTHEQSRHDPLLAHCYANGLTERETIDVLHESNLELRRAHQRIAELTVNPMTIIVEKK